MSTHFYLHCAATNECTEVSVRGGNGPSPRLDPNAVSAFMVYHQSLGHYEFKLRDSENLEDEIIWNSDNYLDLIGRNSQVTQTFKDVERFAGRWIKSQSQ